MWQAQGRELHMNFGRRSSKIGRSEYKWQDKVLFTLEQSMKAGIGVKV
jgi:hypothetical protein